MRCDIVRALPSPPPPPGNDPTAIFPPASDFVCRPPALQSRVYLPCRAVAIIDPLLLLEPERLTAARQAAAASASAGDPASVQPYVTVSVPFRLLSLLHKGKLELADHDDPGNHW